MAQWLTRKIYNNGTSRPKGCRPLTYINNRLMQFLVPNTMAIVKQYTASMFALLNIHALDMFMCFQHLQETGLNFKQHSFVFLPSVFLS